MAINTVDRYIESLPPWQAEIANKLRAIILEAVPEAKEVIKWAQPVYEKGGMFAYFKAFKNTVNFGLRWGTDLNDPSGLLEGEGEKMRHIKLSSLDQIQEELFKDLARQSAHLNPEKK